MQFAIHVVTVDLGSKCGLNLRGGSTEGDPVAAPRHVSYGESLRLQPVGQFLYVAVAQTETVGPLVGGEPLMVARRLAILLVRQELGKSLPLGGGRHRQKGHVTETKRRIRGPLIVLGQCLAMDVPLERHSGSAGQRAWDAVG